MKRRVVVTFAALVATSSLVLMVGAAAGPPATIVTWAGTPQSTAVNSDFPVALQAVVRDSSGNGVEGSSVTFTAPSTGASATFNGSSTTTVSTDGSGIARPPTLRANGIGGSFVLTASVSGVTGTAQFALTNTGGGGAVAPPAPSNLRIMSGGPGPASSVTAASGSAQTAIVNTSFGLPLQAHVSDAAANPVSGITVTFTLPGSGASARFSGSAVATAVSNASGLAVAPTLTANGTTGSYTAVAVATGVFAAATFALTNSPAGPPPPGSGTWTNVTPAGMSMDRDFGGAGANWGVQAVAVDPARPSDLYTTAEAQGLWKSTDYGLTWSRIATTRYRWTVAIDSDAMRNPTTPPTLWSSAGYGLGVAKSTDGGQSWTHHLTNNNVVAAAGGGSGFANDVYQVMVDPTNGRHLLATFHGYAGVSESTDGGVNWRTVTAADGRLGSSLYVFFTEPSPAEASAGASVSSTWLTMSQWESGQGLWRTTNSGASWSKVDTLQHIHGNAQIVTIGGGVVYAAGTVGSQGSGVYRSINYGLSFVRVNNGTLQNGVFATPNYVYADYGWATQGTQPQQLQRAPRSNGTAWMTYYTTPTGMTNGSVQAAVTYNAATQQHIIVVGNRLGGLWRYVE